MKPSHRKDVIIARIIFAVMCLALVAIIAAVVVTISSHRKQAKLEEELKQLQEAQQQQEQETETPTYVVPQPVEEPVEEVHVRATANVNLRAEASTDAEILTTVEAGAEMVLISEENGWAQVTYNDQTGYVSTDFVETVVDDTASDNVTCRLCPHTHSRTTVVDDTASDNVTADEAADDTASDSTTADDTAADSTAN